MTRYIEADLDPGESCPKCGKPIVTWWTDKLQMPDESVPDDKCFINTIDVDFAGPGKVAGNVVIIDHGPRKA